MKSQEDSKRLKGMLRRILIAFAVTTCWTFLLKYFPDSNQ